MDSARSVIHFLYLKAKTKYGIDKRFNVFDII